MTSMSTDFSDESRTRALEAMALRVLDSIPAMVAYWDANQRCVFTNDAYPVWFGRTRDNIIGVSMKELLGSLYDENLPYITGALSGQSQLFEQQIPLRGGGLQESIATYTPDMADGVVRGFFVHVADVTPLKAMERELQSALQKAKDLATHDFLTGLPNRVLLRDRITIAIAHAQRSNSMVAIMSMDMDNFKHINDEFGHGVGDEVLKEVGQRAMTAFRTSDTVSRIGGDEFIVVLTEFPSQDILERTVARVMDSVRRPLKCGDQILTPSFSLGIALYPTNGKEVDDLLLKSDRALYQAKKRGKNCYAFAEDVPAN
jgi:diguanylate cyclase (GGDEF)-like protein/PAS domain S-box-containing protein